MNLEKAKRDLEISIRARYPLIFCETFEENRVERLIHEISEKRGAKVLIWTQTRGFVDSNGTAVDKILAPDKALRFVEEKTGVYTFIFKDIHPFMKDPNIIRLLRDLCASLKLSRKNIILISPVLTVPVELSKEMEVITIPLPSREEIAKVYEGIPEDASRKDQTSEASELLKDECVEAALGLTLDEVENVFAKSLVKHGSILVEEIVAEKRQIIQKAGILDFIPVKESFDSIGGLQNLKEWLSKRKKGFSQEARTLNLPCPKGILLAGLPGCGKSLTAQCTGAAWKLPLVRLDMGKVFSGLVGSSEANMRRALQTAESVAPCILWIDEIEKGMAGSQGGSSDGGTATRVFGSFLTWMQEKESPVFVLATANDISGLPPEMLRKGRFDEIFFVDLPTADERLMILDIHSKKRGWQIEGFEPEAYLNCTEQFTGAEIEQGLVDARFDAYFHQGDITMAMLEAAFRRTVPLAQIMKEKFDMVRSWAETRAVPASPRRMREGAKNPRERLLEV